MVYQDEDKVSLLANIAYLLLLSPHQLGLLPTWECNYVAIVEQLRHNMNFEQTRKRILDGRNGNYPLPLCLGEDTCSASSSLLSI